MATSLKEEFHSMISKLNAKFKIPNIKRVYFPPYIPTGQTKSTEFMAMELEGGAIGVSYVFIEQDQFNEFIELQNTDFKGQNPVNYAMKFGTESIVKNTMCLASINAICQYVIKQINYPLNFTTDSMGLLNIKKDDTVGMVGFFAGLIGLIKREGAKLIIIEKKSDLIEKYPKFHITLDPTELQQCNKVLCTSTTVGNNTLDNILDNCKKASVSIIGPTAGYFPDPLFKRGVNVLGGNSILEPEPFWNAITTQKPWGDTGKKFCFVKENYPGLDKILK